MFLTTRVLSLVLRLRVAYGVMVLHRPVEVLAGIDGAVLLSLVICARRDRAVKKLQQY